jgi:hypothetical protein
MKSFVFVLIVACLSLTCFIREASADREAQKARMVKKYFELVGQFSDCVLKPVPGVTIHPVMSSQYGGSNEFFLLINDGEYEFFLKSPCYDPVIQLK